MDMKWDTLRGERDSRLYQMDVYQLPMPNSALTETQRSELVEYRDALLTLPQDYDTPEEAWENFPTKPSWMT